MSEKTIGYLFRFVAYHEEYVLINEFELDVFDLVMSILEP